jgi:hypothetical protein
MSLHCKYIMSGCAGMQFLVVECRAGQSARQPGKRVQQTASSADSVHARCTDAHHTCTCGHAGYAFVCVQDVHAAHAMRPCRACNTCRSRFLLFNHGSLPGTPCNPSDQGSSGMNLCWRITLWVCLLQCTCLTVQSSGEYLNAQLHAYVRSCH